MVERFTSRGPAFEAARGCGEWAPSACGSEDGVGRHELVAGGGVGEGDRATAADGEGDVRELPAPKSAPGTLDNTPLIDGFVWRRRLGCVRYANGCVAFLSSLAPHLSPLAPH